MRNPINHDQKLQALKKLPLFVHLNDSDIVALGQSCDRLTVRPGTVLARQGGTPTHLSIIVAGTAAVTVDDVEVAVLGQGAYVGEIALIDDGSSTATVTTLEPTTVWYIARSGLLPILEANPSMAQVLLRDVAGKLRHTNAFIGSPVLDRAMGRITEVAGPAERVDRAGAR